MTKNNLPKHIVIIPDGNRRWAKERKLEPWEGHEEGAKLMERLVKKALAMGIKSLSFWGSSVDNLKKRPIRETRALLGIYEKYFLKLIKSEDIHRHEARINIIGRWREQFPGKLRKILEEGVKETGQYKKCLLNFFLAYNGDDEMLEAVRKISHKYGSSLKKITADVIKENLMTKDLPAVDLMIRTGGEPHLSAGFMMWDVANAQLYFTEKNFPDFSEADLEKAVGEFQKRERRMGK